MSSLSLRVLELFDENRLSFNETEKLLRAISSNQTSKFTIQSNKIHQTKTYIPPHLPSYMDGFTLDRQI